MTAREWVKENYPTFVDDEFVGGVMGCPNSLFYKNCPVGRLDTPHSCIILAGPMTCAACWNRELPEVTG